MINTSSSSPAINKRRRSVPAISVTTCGTVVRRRRVDNTWPVAAFTARSEARYRLRIEIYPTPPAFNAPLKGSRQNIAMTFGTEKLEWCGYPMVKIFLKICLFVSTECTDVTDRYTDTHTDRHRMTTKAALT